jgi:hypothetical protein
MTTTIKLIWDSIWHTPNFEVAAVKRDEKVMEMILAGKTATLYGTQVDDTELIYSREFVDNAAAVEFSDFLKALAIEHSMPLSGIEIIAEDGTVTKFYSKI